MNPENAHFDGGLTALIESGKTIQPLSGGIRARALVRARAAAEAALPAEAAHGPAPIPVLRKPRLVLALAASLAVVVCTAGAVAALYVRAANQPPPAPAPKPLVVPAPTVSTPAPPSLSPTVDLPNRLPSKPQRFGRPATPQESYAAELRLLQRAHAAYAIQDYANALTLVAEHRRQFPNGRLSEEREALRVRALAGAGRMDEARRTAAAFAERFPRSVLLPRLGMESK
jgi:hypothetical protein